jgi:hypothetical protein
MSPFEPRADPTQNARSAESSSSGPAGSEDAAPDGGGGSQPSAPDRRGLGLSVPQIVGSALAAASAAVASSLLGVTGTAIGAVLASVVISVGTALYTRPIERTSQVLKETLPVRADRIRAASDREDEGSAPTGATAASRPGHTGSRRGLGGPVAILSRRKVWTAVALSSVATIALTFAVLTGVEGITGGPVSSWTGHGSHSGTTLGHLIDPGGAGSSPDSPGRNASQQDQPTGPAGGTSAPTVPTVTVTVSSTPTPTSPALSNPAPSTATPTSPGATTPTVPTPTSPTPTSVTSPKAASRASDTTQAFTG